ncbi:hypothetical protein DFH09DRAFT_1319034 [Mycena vulgaris]|nr:hypothetical protein DFH09DRAFT_1319034 [Mycena vulgaris]
MLWLPLSRQTRSGREFSALSLPLSTAPIRDATFDFAPLVARAAAAEDIREREDAHEQDHEDDDERDADENDAGHHAALGDAGALLDAEGVDEQWPPAPPAPPTDPWDEVDDIDPAKAPPSPRKRRRTSFDDVVASDPNPHTGPHRHRPAKPKRQANKDAAAAARRKTKRAREKQARGHAPAASTIQEHVKPAAAAPLATHLDTPTLPAALGAYAAKLDPKKKRGPGCKVRRTLADMLGLGFQLVEWDGFTPRPLVDSAGRVFAVLAGQPRNDTYRDAARRAFHAICDAGAAARFPPAMYRHRRGLFAAINVGLSYGKGQSTPGWLHTEPYAETADGLLANVDVGRLAGFGDAAFALWAPRLHGRYRACDETLRKAHPNLRRPFAHSVFFCTAFNFGRNVWTFKHRDVLNLAYGWCAVQALGDFDPKKGGHLVLWDLNLVVEFPAGALILLPSATIAHSNVPVQDNEQRASFTQFSAGGIFRYVDNGCRTEKELEEEDPAEYARLMALKAARWQEGLNMYSTMDELLNP